MINEWCVPELDEPEPGTVLQDELGRVWVRRAERWSSTTSMFVSPTWPQLLSMVKRLRRLVPAEPDNTPPPDEQDPSTDGDGPGDGLDLDTHLRNEVGDPHGDYTALRRDLCEVLGLAYSTSDDTIVAAVTAKFIS